MNQKKEDSPLLSKFGGEVKNLVQNVTEEPLLDLNDQKIRYLVTALICMSFLCLVSIF